MMLSSSSSAIAALIALLLVLQVVTASLLGRDCSCGYSVNTTSDQEYAVFTEILETNFRHLTSPWLSRCWELQNYNMTPNEAHGTYGKMAVPSNVIANPLVSTPSGSLSSKNGGDAGLQLWVNSTAVDNRIPMAEIVARDQSMAYGSFRVGMKVTNVSGTCTGFFWYRNNTEEIDMEFLSSNTNSSSHPIYLVLQTGKSQSSDIEEVKVPTFEILQLPFDPALAFHEYRFDWTPDKVSFYADGSWIQDIDWKYPKAEGSLSLNHWSNGNMGWSQGPPESNAVTTIAYVKAYYNSTSPTKQALYNTRCPYPKGMDKVCQIPNYISGDIDEKLPSFLSPTSQCGEKTMSRRLEAAPSNKSTTQNPSPTVEPSSTAQPSPPNPSWPQPNSSPRMEIISSPTSAITFTLGMCLSFVLFL